MEFLFKKFGRFRPSSAILFFLNDFFTIYGGYLLSYYLYGRYLGIAPQSFNEFRTIALIPAGVGVFAFVLSSVYRGSRGIMGLDQLRRILSSYFWSQMICFALTFFMKAQTYSRLTASLGFALSAVFLLLGREILNSFLEPMRRRFDLHKKVLILGAGQVGKQLGRNLIAGIGPHAVLGFLDDQYPALKQTSIKVGTRDFLVPVLGPLSAVETVCRERKANEVIVAISHATQNLQKEMLEKARELGIHFSIVPSALDLMLSGGEAYSIGRIPLFRIGARPQFVFSPALKRVLDIVGGFILAVLSAPVWVVTAIAIKLDSPGPVLFVHERVGKDGKRFMLFKFRSMHISTSPYAVTPQNTFDPRITRMGRFIRRTSIDELPQILNVLQGTMSLVGPRPEMPFIVDTYDDLQRLRLSVKPGLTGVWQISADRANPIHENIDYDLYYLENQSFWLDLAILLKTFTSVIRGVGAY
jgi:exopolysaccharide biosynthesis polyprenyl glycosylphosphotransferase